jgi:parallel beta-helix repeat protein
MPSTNVAGFGPRVAVGPRSSVTCPADSISIEPSSNIQSVVNSHAAGTIYCLAPGTFARQEIKPKSHDKYIGVAGATLDGQNISTYAFTGDAQGVTIQNLVIRNYRTGPQNAPINPGWAGGGIATNWSVINNEIYGNSAGGIYSGGGDHVVANYIHDNGQEGYSATGAGAIYSDNIIAHNNFADQYCKVPATAECGGGKAWKTTDVTISYNYIHDNHGPGIWDDTDNQGTVIEYNDIEKNWMSGIMHEISWDATIRNNYVANNANAKAQYCPFRNYWCAEIFITNSGGVGGKVIDVSENTLRPNSIDGGVMLLNSSRGESTTYRSRGPWLVQNVKVHDNKTSMVVGSIVGAFDQDGTDAAMFTSQGNSFDYDSYRDPVSNDAFYWNGAGSFAAFQTKRQELHGGFAGRMPR